MNNVLCLDLGQHCGYAKLVDGKIVSGVWNFAPSKFDSIGAKFVKFKRQLEAEIIIDDTRKVFFEAVQAHVATYAAHDYGGYVAILQSVCLENDVEYEGVPVGTIKKHGCGKGNGDKKMMEEAAARKFPSINIIDDNHADALHLLDYCRTQRMLS